jgi:hypothetical protein
MTARIRSPLKQARIRAAADERKLAERDKTIRLNER